MFPKLLNYRKKGYPQYIQANEEKRIFLLQHQSEQAFELHQNPIHSICQNLNETIIASATKINIINRTMKTERTLSEYQTIIRTHPNLSYQAIADQKYIKFYDNWNQIEKRRMNHTTDICFLLDNLYVISSEDGIHFYDHRSGAIAYKGGVDWREIQSLGTDGVDIYSGGKKQSCLDVRNFKERWSVDVSGKIVMKNGIGIVYDEKFCHCIDLNGKKYWTFQKNNISCVELSDDGEFFLIGYTNGIIEMFSTANGTFMKKLENNHSKRITAMNWSSVTMNLITGSEGGKIVGWNGWNNDSQISMIDDDEKVDWEWD